MQVYKRRNRLTKRKNGKLKQQEKESLVILALSGYDIDINFKDRISKFVSSLKT